MFGGGKRVNVILATNRCTRDNQVFIYDNQSKTKEFPGDSRECAKFRGLNFKSILQRFKHSLD